MSEKMGRNPFGSKPSSAKSEIPSAEKVAERESSLHEEGPKVHKPREPKKGDVLALIRNWKLERFSFLRFERGREKSHVDFLTVSLTHPKWKKTGTYRIQLLGGKKLTLGLLSARVQKL